MRIEPLLGVPTIMALTRLEIESPVVPTKRRIETPILRTDKLVKIYGGRSVLNGIDIHVNEARLSAFWDQMALVKPPRFIL